MRSFIRQTMLGLATLATLFLFAAIPAQGQVAWESPLLVSPSSPSGWSVMMVDPGYASGIGVMGAWSGAGPLGFRVGFAEDAADDLAVFGGFDASGALVRRSDEFPFDVDWVTGAGISVGDFSIISLPLGLSIGHDVQLDGVWINPYLTPRVVLDAFLGAPEGADELDMRFAADLGIDMRFAQSWAIRFGASLGDESALAVGLSFQP